MNSLLTTQAFQAFKNGQYHSARNLYLEAEQRVGPGSYRCNLTLCKRREESAFLKGRSGQLVSAPDEPFITYCVPAMNRFQDLRKTLPHNVAVLSRFRSVQLMVNLFDKDDEALQWIQTSFPDELAEGLLVANQLPAMEGWHMSEGKNSFQPLLSTGYYSNLDSDNYLSTDEIVKTKQAINEFGECLIHYFSGDWGDGSCGHITLPVALYRRAGYTQELYPRQFDELSLIANVVSEQPDLPILTRHGVNIFTKTQYLREFTEFNEFSPNVIPCDLGEVQSPDNGKMASYAEQDPLLKFYSELNGYYSVYKASRSQRAKAHFLERLKGVQRVAARSDLIHRLARETLKLVRFPLIQTLSPNTTLYTVVDLSSDSIEPWLAHQRSRGTQRFVLIDASPNPVEEKAIQRDDVVLIKPLVGDVTAYKDFWVHCAKALMESLVPKSEVSPSSLTCVE